MKKMYAYIKRNDEFVWGEVKVVKNKHEKCKLCKNPTMKIILNCYFYPDLCWRCGEIEIMKIELEQNRFKKESEQFFNTTWENQYGNL